MSLTIAYAPTEGITLIGTERGHAPAIKAASGTRWRWYSAGGFWYVPRTRDTVQSLFRVEQLATDLRRSLASILGPAAPEVVVSFDLGEGVRPAEEVEAEKRERAEARAERLEDQADRLAAEGKARLAAADSIASVIPMGQPILVGHHSERRHRKDLERIQTNTMKGLEALEDAKATRAAAVRAGRAASGAVDPGATMRRVDRLEADRRRIERELDGEDELRAGDDLGSACPDGPACQDPRCSYENKRRASLAETGKGVKLPFSDKAGYFTVKRFPGSQRRLELEARRAAIVLRVQP